MVLNINPKSTFSARSRISRMTCTLAFWFAVSCLTPSLTAYCLDISDNPMETYVQAAPPNIMFVLDDSGSMDWEIMTTESDGLFKGYYYTFDDSGDNAYSGSILSGDYRLYWQAQWNGYNRIYYNPFVNYQPWPNMSNADTSTPRSNPNNASPVFNLDDTYMSVMSMSGPMIIVDNQDAAPNFISEGYWPESNHNSTEYEESAFANNTSGQVFWAPELTASGTYKVLAWWSCNSWANRDRYAEYTVYDGNGDETTITKDQRTGAGQWQSLGEFYFSAGSPDWPEIIVDNQDGAPSYVLNTSSYGESGYRPEYYGSSYYFGGSGSSATFTPTIPETNTYEVYAWWNCCDNRDSNAQITINYNGGSDVLYKSQQATTSNVPETGICGEWIHLGDYEFAAGTTGNVVIERHSGSTGVHTVSDAVKFVRTGSEPPQHVKLTRGDSNSDYPTSADAILFIPPGSSYETVNISNAHYFMLDDTDGDGEHDEDEDIYLISFDSGVRNTYLVNSVDTNEKIDSYITLVSDPPDSIRPKVYDEEGNFVRYATDAEDLQNFANWYSYYRRRELTAKAAVSNVINSLSGVKVGYYSINSSSTNGLRVPVQPVKVDMIDQIIVDNNDSGFTTSGNWHESSNQPEYGNSSLYTSTSGDSATWTPSFSSSGTYKVYAWWNCYNNRDQNAKFTIVHANGTETVYKNQRDETDGACGEWVELGSWDFDAGTSGSVTVSRHSSSTGSSTVADAIKFVNTSGTLVNTDETDALLEALYGLDSSGGTPLRNALLNVGRYYDANDSYTGNLGDSPYASEADAGGCQQSFAIVMTDGFYNGGSPGVGNQDSGMAAPYGDTYENTLADVAMKYYNTDLSGDFGVDDTSPDLPDVVPTNSCDNNDEQHMVTYSISFGVTGTLTPQDSDGDGEEDDPCFLDDDTTLPTWPNPASGDKQKIDDLWHAAVNGHGAFFSAANPEDLVSTMESVFEDISSRFASGASVSVNGEELESDTVLYQATFSSGDWIGDVIAYPIDVNTGEVKQKESDILWKASGEGDHYGLQDMDWDNDRLIVTMNDVSESGVPFRLADISDNQKILLDPDWTSADETLASNIVDYIRGDEITGFRSRTRKLGDIVHSAPLLVNNTIYAGGNDGMLHAFDAETGRERFAYIPNLVFGNLKYLTETDFTHLFFVDQTPYSQYRGTIGNDNKTLLVGGLGKGGKGYFCLDITNADSFGSTSSESDVDDIPMWEFPDSGTSSADVADLGYSYSTGYLVQTNSTDHEWVVIFGNGYDSPNGSAVLFILDALSGEVVKKIDTGATGSNGLSKPAIIDVDNDYITDYVYAGDLNGNLWKFNLKDEDSDNWDIAYNDGATPTPAPKPLFTATGQPITSAPDVMEHPSGENGLLVIFGTGKYLGETDRTNTDQQSVYGIWDYGDDDDPTEYLGSITDRTTGALSYPESYYNTNTPGDTPYISLVKQTVATYGSESGTYYRVLSDNPVVWYDEDHPFVDDPDGDPQNPNPVVNAGWFFDFPNSGDFEGERVFNDITIRSNVAIVLSFIPDDSPCSGGGSSFLYYMDAANGGLREELMVDLNGDGVLDENDMVTFEDENGDTITTYVSSTHFDGELHSPKFVEDSDGNEVMYMSTSAGTIATQTIQGQRTGMYYWLMR